MTKAELIRALSCVNDDKELLCTISFIENDGDYIGYIDSVNISFAGEDATARLSIREIKTTTEFDIAA
jgi:hypothetical protein